MTALLRLSSRLYSGILVLYQPDLRRDFESEMKELFDEDLAEAWQNRGFPGVLNIWWCALSEVFRIALPAHKTNPAIIVPAIAFAVNAVMVGAEMMLPGAQASGHIGQPVIGTSIAVAVTALVVVHTGKVKLLSIAG